VSGLPVRKYVKVWIKRRKNRVRQGGTRGFSYTLQWVQFGRERFQSLGPYATLAYTREAARRKEAELNSFEHEAGLDPITWDDFAKKYLNTFYPGHDLKPKERKEAMVKWGKSLASMKSERLALGNFGRLIQPGWLHEVTTAEREKFVTDRLAEVPSPASVDADLRVLRAVFNVAGEWKHRPENSNPFAGRGKATVGSRRKRQKERGQEEKAKHYTFEEVKAILARATKEAAEDPTFAKKRLRALVYFVAYTGCRINEAVHLEWQDVDWDQGVAWLFFKVENDLKTEGSQAPFGLPDKLSTVLRAWEADRKCSWVFPNSDLRPWKTGGPGYRPFDQLKELAGRAGVKDANWKRFRHSLSTHGKGRFGMTTEQVRAQLRHTTDETQKHYTHDNIVTLRRAVQGVDFEG
jgi:integrase